MPVAIPHPMIMTPEPKELLSILRLDEAISRTVEQRKLLARERWKSLPAVIKDVFANAPKVAMYEALKRMGVDAQPSRSVEWFYTALNDSLIVTIWHDQIRTDLGPDILYYIPTAAWGQVARLSFRAENVRQQLANFAGRSVGALLLKHEWDKANTQFAKRVAPDIKRWFVEQLTDDEFLLRRGPSL